MVRASRAARAAKQVGQSAGALPANSPGPVAGTGNFVDPQQLAQLVMAARAAKQVGRGVSAAQQSAPAQALPISVLGPTSPFAAGAGPQPSAPVPDPDPAKAAAIQKLRQAQANRGLGAGRQSTTGPAIGQTPPNRPQIPLGSAPPPPGVPQSADYVRRIADYLKWRNQNFRPATGGGWESPSGRLYTDQDLGRMYSADQQEALWAQQKREEERHASAVARGRIATITYPDGTRETRKGNHPQRDNNPGNMKAGNITRSHGAVGRDGTFAIFASAEDWLGGAG